MSKSIEHIRGYFHDKKNKDDLLSLEIETTEELEKVNNITVDAKSPFDEVYEDVLEAPKPYKNRKALATVESRSEFYKGPFMLFVNKTVKRKFTERDVPIFKIDWRSLERNKYAPWGRGINSGLDSGLTT